MIFSIVAPILLMAAWYRFMALDQRMFPIPIRLGMNEMRVFIFYVVMIAFLLAFYIVLIILAFIVNIPILAFGTDEPNITVLIIVNGILLFIAVVLLLGFIVRLIPSPAIMMIQWNMEVLSGFYASHGVTLRMIVAYLIAYLAYIPFLGFYGLGMYTIAQAVPFEPYLVETALGIQQLDFPAWLEAMVSSPAIVIVGLCLIGYIATSLIVFGMSVGISVYAAKHYLQRQSVGSK
jgi:hypothetical protein